MIVTASFLQDIAYSKQKLQDIECSFFFRRDIMNTEAPSEKRQDIDIFPRKSQDFYCLFLLFMLSLR